MKLNLGVGRESLEGWLNVDLQQYPGVDKLLDLDDVPWPWDDQSFDEIKAFDILEHVDDIVAVMSECWRVLQPGEQMTIRGPVWGGPNHRDDPTHRCGFTERSFNYWCPAMQPSKPPLLYGIGTWEMVRVWVIHANIHFRLRRLP